MTWRTLRTHAQRMGFDIAYRCTTMEGGGYAPDLTSPPQGQGPWLCVGSYEQVGGLWVQPVTAATRDWTPARIASAITSIDPFIAPVAGYDAEFSSDFLAAGAAGMSAANNPAVGCMPA